MSTTNLIVSGGDWLNILMVSDSCKRIGIPHQHFWALGKDNLLTFDPVPFLYVMAFNSITFNNKGSGPQVEARCHALWHKFGIHCSALSIQYTPK